VLTSAKLKVYIFNQVDDSFVRTFSKALEGQDVSKYFACGSGASAGSSGAQ
jgi:hypothetical protein